jgi:predicted dehydrogenase
MAKPITALLFGAGSRGAEAYGPYALIHPNQLKFVGVAEPNRGRRERFAAMHDIPAANSFDSWRHALDRGKMADVVINCTQDQMHPESSIAALEAGYDMLLEKPIANTLVGSISIVQSAEKHDRYLQICHVLRYTDLFKKVHELLRSGRLGQVITISHRENVSAWHMAHSYVRGNWRREERSSPMILAKCCHDLDLLVWFTGKLPIKLSSHGSLSHFTPENAPPGAPERCTDGCPVEATCPFYAPAIYIDLMPFKQAVSQTSNPLYRLAGNISIKSPQLINMLAQLIPQVRELKEFSGWPRSVICDDPGSENALMKALQEGLYGRCVYHCDNDVVDHQVVAIEFEDGITASLTMHGHSHEEGRTLRIDGSKASLLAKFGFSRSYIEIHDHRSREVERMDFPSNVEHFVRAMRGAARPSGGARESLESHLMAFAAEESRHNQVVVDMANFKARAEQQALDTKLIMDGDNYHGRTQPG